MIRREPQAVCLLRDQCRMYLFGGDGNSPTGAYEDLRARSLSLFKRFGTPSADGEDLFQKALIKVTNGALATYRCDSIGLGSKGEVDERFRNWFLTIVGNLARDHYRREKKFDTTPIEIFESPNVSDSRGGGFLDSLVGSNPAMGRGSDLEIIASTALQLLNSLSERLSSVFSLWVDGLAYKEIAQALDLPLGTVKSRLHTLKLTLQVKLVKIHPCVRDFL